MPEIIVATSNSGKVEELKALLPDGIIFHTLKEFEILLPPESGDTFAENAGIKACAAARAGLPAIADDSGIVVDALNGAPGVRSARYAGPSATDDDNNAKLLAELAKNPGVSRSAAFVSVVVLAFPNGDAVQATGTVRGVIVDEPRGAGGFGYDPLFEIQDDGAGSLNGRTMAEIGLDEKNRISHRGRAYRHLLDELKSNPELLRMAFGIETLISGSQ